MNNEQLGQIFYSASDTLIGTSGQWEIWVGDVPLLCITDKRHNRMRIISPVKEVKDANSEDLLKCLEANFHTALDVKYSISEDVIWVAFIHPLQELTKEQVLDAMAQVRAGVLTYGTIYTSTDLTFPKKEEREKKEGKGKTKKS
ncbi:MAG: hypothetical protein ACI9XB_001699 [Gammaproteobacteria bacterium]|jgi:hypothetical protein